MSRIVTLRLPEETAEALHRLARRENRSLNEVGRRIVEEWLRQDRFAHIEFRAVAGERHACVKDRLPVWQLVMVAQGYGMAVEPTARHLRLTPEQVQAALTYYATYPEEIDQALADNALGYEGLKTLLPGLELLEVEVAEES